MSNKNIHKNCIALLATRRSCIVRWLACMLGSLVCTRFFFRCPCRWLLFFLFSSALCVCFLFHYGISGQWQYTQQMNTSLWKHFFVIFCCRSHIYSLTRSQTHKHTVYTIAVACARVICCCCCCRLFPQTKLLPRPVRFHLFLLFIFHKIYFHFFSPVRTP